MTVSKFFPKTGLPTEKWKGAKPKYVLEDMFWFSFDKGATHGFRERGIAVPEFSVPGFIGSEAQWRKAGFGRKPTIREAIDFGLSLAATAIAKRGVEWLVPDTLSSLDAALEAHGRNNMPKGGAEGDKDDTRKMYGDMFYGHKLFHDAVRSLGCGIIYCCHGKAVDDVAKLKPEEKKRLITLSSAGMPEFLPAITGKGATAYKGDASLQLAIIAKEIPGAKGKERLDRKAYTILQDKWEAKNRFELSLDPIEKPDLGAMLRKIRG
jgi:hypothetical protein